MRRRYVQRRHFFIRDMVEKLEITVPYVHTDDNASDIFTKFVDPKTFKKHRATLMNLKPEYAV